MKVKLPDDIQILNNLTKYLSTNYGKKTRYDRLLIDSRIYDSADVVGTGVFKTNGWGVIKSLQWKTDECPIPENETLLHYNL